MVTTTKKKTSLFNQSVVLHELKHYLPAQAPLKDFVHHNTLHAFQHLPFFEGIRTASKILGYKTTISIDEFRQLYLVGRIRKDILEHIVAQKASNKSSVSELMEKLLHTAFDLSYEPRIGKLKANWKNHYKVDLNTLVFATLFRTVCSYLDQGISIWTFPVERSGFITTLRELEKKSLSSLFRTPRAKKLLMNTKCKMKDLLDVLVGDEALYEQYLYDQQFSHQGWSGMISAIEDNPSTILDHRNISLQDFIVFELLLEIDTLDYYLGENWQPMAHVLPLKPINLFEEVASTELDNTLQIWQEAFEWSYYDEVLAGIQLSLEKKNAAPKSFQAMFCIDDRECSIRRYVEQCDPNSETFGTPGFFGVEFFYQPAHGKFYTKVCPGPITPKHLIKEISTNKKHAKDAHFTKHSHSLHSGWLISQTLGFWSAIRLFINIFKPSMSPAASSSFKHMDEDSTLTIENKSLDDIENGLQIGFTVEEMATRVENVLKSIGLTTNFAPIVYVLGHGASSANNPHYAAYDCGACSGRAGSVNARAFSFMANHTQVRAILANKGIVIPADTQFVGGLRDTTRDEVVFYDEDPLLAQNQTKHQTNKATFAKALDLNAKERSRRFVSVDTTQKQAVIHDKIRERSVSLFEPRPELNHATNALAIVGRRDLTKGLFLDRRAFLNSYNYQIDPEGQYLLNILNAATPVCGGINLEYYFSRVDNRKLGAGTKLPHNVMGLIGVANGIDGDLRPGLPSQMIEVHDPIRIMFIIEHLPEIVLSTIQKNPATYQWFTNEWVKMVVVSPISKSLYVFENGDFVPYTPLRKEIPTTSNVSALVETSHDNLPVYLINS